MTAHLSSAQIGIIGGGAWGTALAQALAGPDHDVCLWAREEEVVYAINRDHTNPLFLPDITLHAAVRATSDLDDLAAAGLLLAVAPAQHLDMLLRRMPTRHQPLLLCSKGMEQTTRRLMTEVAAGAGWIGPVAVLSGPTFAHELAAGMPAAVTLAAETMVVAQGLARVIARRTLRPYASDDPLGAEIGGVVKNVLAIACGVVDGAGLGQNARAALISRGFAEMTRYGLARGGRLETLTGLAGLGDLVLTCSSVASRNFSLGRGLGAGQDAATLLANRTTVAEGAFSAGILVADAEQRGVDMPICSAVARMIAGEWTAPQAIEALLNRPLQREGWDGLD